MPPTNHNHVTRDIKRLGECLGCDLTHVLSKHQAVLLKLQACCLDDDNDFKRVLAAIAEATIELIDLDRSNRV